MCMPKGYVSKESSRVLEVFTFGTAAINSNSDIGWSVLFENVIDIVITAGVAGSRTACNEMLKCVALTRRVLELGGVSGKAEEKAHSSSSAAGAAGGLAAGFGFAKSNIEG